ncbi:DUF4349 domain-containing protein [Streptosporangium longisporum]|uniref:DUF4349 domain-containing protein n=1 Tax=Streptosporangium longisporum TaxID=46187 RepID=A0ABP6KYI1_9ACTN
MNRFRYGPRAAVALAGLALLVTACGGGAMTSSDAVAPAAPAAGSGSGSDGGSEAGSARRQAPGETAAKVESRDEAAKPGQVEVVPQDRAIVYTAEMTVRAKDVTAAADTARRVVTAAGGYLAMERSDSRSEGEGSATLVFKIPPGNYPGTLDRLGRELGTRESLTQNTEDVTEEVADVESRLKSARAALESLRTLLKRANTIGEVLQVERELSDRESELESLQARQKSLAAQTSVATLTLNLVGPAAVVKQEEEEPSGFLEGLRKGWSAFVTAVKVGLTLLGVLLPWLVAIGLVWAIVAFVLRRRGRDGHRPAPAGRPAAPGGPALGADGDRTDGEPDTQTDRRVYGEGGSDGHDEDRGNAPGTDGPRTDAPRTDEPGTDGPRANGPGMDEPRAEGPGAGGRAGR